MTKFVKFRSRRYSNATGWELDDLSVNIDNISIIKDTNAFHSFKKYDIEKNSVSTIKEPCTYIKLIDGSNMVVLGSYDEVLEKINGLDKHSNTINPWNSDEVETIKDIKPLIFKHEDSPVIGTNTIVHIAEDGSISGSFKPTEYGKEFIDKYFTVHNEFHTEIDINKIEKDFQDGQLTQNQIREIFDDAGIKDILKKDVVE